MITNNITCSLTKKIMTIFRYYYLYFYTTYFHFKEFKNATRRKWVNVINLYGHVLLAVVEINRMSYWSGMKLV